MTATTPFGSGRRESHDASGYYRRAIGSVTERQDSSTATPAVQGEAFCHSAEEMGELPSTSIALVVTSPPYHVGKSYDTDASFEEHLALLERVFAECHRVLQPGGRAVVNVANLGRRPYVPFAQILTARLVEMGFLMRGEVIWVKAKGAGGSCAWGSWRSPANPVLRDVHECCLCFSKGRFDRAVHGVADISAKEFCAATLSVWEIPPEHAGRVGHPAPFPVELARRFIRLYTYRDEWVLDPFMGSGTTAVAAVTTGRKWVGYELDPAYCALTRRRVAAAEAVLPLGI